MDLQNDGNEDGVFNSQNYQTELIDYTTENDSIIILPSEHVKSYISVLLMNHWTLSAGALKKTAVILVDNDISIEQYLEYINQNTSLKVQKWDNRAIEKHQKEFKAFVDENDVIIMTGQRFGHALDHGLVSFDVVALMVMTDCHLCSSEKHPYRLIMQNFKEYKKGQGDNLLRFVGFTDCGLSGKIFPRTLADNLDRLERITQAKIFSSNDLSQKLPKECVLYFKKNQRTNLSILNRAAKTIANLANEKDDNLIVKMKNNFNQVLKVLDVCGEYAVYPMVQAFIKNWETKLSSQLQYSEIQRQVLNLGLDSFKSFTSSMGPIMNVNEFNELKPYLSSMVLRILDLLQAYHNKKAPEAMVALIFVETRAEAAAFYKLLSVLSKISPLFSFIRPSYAMGSTADNLIFDESDNVNATPYSIDKAITDLNIGVTNVLVTTPILERQIDIHNCNLVIRINIPPNFTSYIQTRSYLHTPDSMFVIVADEEDKFNVLYNITLFKRNEKVLKRYFKNLKTTEAIEKTVFDLDVNDLERPYKVPSTQATATLTNSIDLINRYCASLSSDAFIQKTAKFNLYKTPLGYIASLVFPVANSPLKGPVQGLRYASEKIARMSAALKTVQMLHEMGELTDYLYPKTLEEKMLGAIEDDLEDSGAFKKPHWHSRKTADCLQNIFPTADDLFLIYCIEVELPVYQPNGNSCMFGICSTQALPKVSKFPIYPVNEDPTMISISTNHELFALNSEQIPMVLNFNNYLFSELLGITKNLGFIGSESLFQAMIVPLKINENGTSMEIDFEVLQKAVQGFSQPLISENERQTFDYRTEKFQNAVVKPWYRDNENIAYYVQEANTLVYPISDFPGKQYRDYAHYFEDKYNIRIINQHQQLLNVKRVAKLSSFLVPHMPKLRQKAQYQEFLIPELMSVHSMPMSFWKAAYQLPTILYRFNGMLLAAEFSTTVAHEAFKVFLDSTENLEGDPNFVPPKTILQALTTKSAHEEVNLERLETIGDSFLKLSVTNYFFQTQEIMQEGILTKLRSMEVSNKNLYNLAIKAGIDKMIMSTKFEPSVNWLPPGFRETITPENDDNERVEAQIYRSHQNIRDKSIADCVEALIGAYLNTLGPEKTLKFMQWLGLKVLPDHFEKWTPSKPTTEILNVFESLHFSKLEKSIRYKFQNKALLIQAFTHASYGIKGLTASYERLEFLGDAVLDYLVMQHLYGQQLQHSPGTLTDIKSATVNNNILASFGIQLGLHKFLLYESPDLALKISDFANVVKEKDLINIDDDIIAPKPLGDIFESLAGAIYIDCGYDLSTVWKFFYPILISAMEKYCLNPPKSPIRELLELYPDAIFRNDDNVNGGFQVTVEIKIDGMNQTFKGKGSSRRNAKIAAAKLALLHIASLLT